MTQTTLIRNRLSANASSSLLEPKMMLMGSDSASQTQPGEATQSPAATEAAQSEEPSLIRLASEPETRRILRNPEMPGLRLRNFTIGELNDRRTEIFGAEPAGEFLGLTSQQRAATRLSDEELAELSQEEFLDVLATTQSINDPDILRTAPPHSDDDLRLIVEHDEIGLVAIQDLTFAVVPTDETPDFNSVVDENVLEASVDLAISEAALAGLQAAQSPDSERGALVTQNEFDRIQRAALRDGAEVIGAVAYVGNRGSGQLFRISDRGVLPFLEREGESADILNLASRAQAPVNIADAASAPEVITYDANVNQSIEAVHAQTVPGRFDEIGATLNRQGIIDSNGIVIGVDDDINLGERNNEDFGGISIHSQFLPLVAVRDFGPNFRSFERARVQRASATAGPFARSSELEAAFAFLTDDNADFSSFIDLPLEEVESLTVGELNDLVIAGLGEEPDGFFLGLSAPQRESSGLSNEELSDLTPTQFLEIVQGLDRSPSES